MQEENIKKANYKCPKCSSSLCEIGKIYAAGNFLSKILNIQAKRFTTVTCSQCKYTEFYKGNNAGAWENVLDFIAN